jgi:uncharacterized protein (DUF4213/DUF364 family)
MGTPARRDFPILEGKERLIEATVNGARGQAFTDCASEYNGTFLDVLNMPLDNNRDRAVFLAATNAALAHLRLATGTVHCKHNDPEKCAFDIAMSARITDAQTVGLVGFNPAIAEALVKEFGTEAVRITDLNPQNIGTTKFGVTIWDARAQTPELVKTRDLILATGTTLVNGTFDELLTRVRAARKRLVFYGVTAAGVCRVLGLERWCALAQDGGP